MQLSRRFGRAAAVRAVLMIMVAAGSSGAGAAAAQEHYSVTGAEVAIYNLVGSFQIVAGTGNDITVDVTRGGKDAGQLKVETGMKGTRNTLRVIYPGRKIRYDKADGWWNSSLKVNSDGTFSDKNAWGQTVTISNRGDGIEAHADLVIKVPAGKTLDVYGVVGEMNATNVTGDLRLDSGASAISADGIKGSLSVDVGSGNVDVSHCTGELSVDTGSGDVSLSDVMGDLVSLETGSGTVHGRTIKAPRLVVNTGSGEVDLTALDVGSIHADTGSGDVSLGLTSATDEVMVDTGSGSVDLMVPAGLGAMLSVEVGSGDIDIQVPMAEIHKDEDSVRGRIGNGSGHIVIETGSGGVTVAAAH